VLEGGEASVEDIDGAIRSAGFPMGPFELMDLVGIDVNLAAARGVWEGFERADRFRPSPLQERLVAEGRLGRKSSSGFYRYDDGRRGPVEEVFAGTERHLHDDLVVERIVLAIVAEAWRALGDDVASAADIDLALRLGAGHPIGPFERTTELGGPSAVLAQLDRLRVHGPRFEPPERLNGAAV
jgi:3-hydroxybutyryl-CoA dehydrogenase